MNLNLVEELLLLALQDEKGTVVMAAGTGLPYGLAGALLMELSLKNKIRLEGKNILPVDFSSTGDFLLDGWLEKIRKSEKPRTARHWIGKFGQASSLKKEYLERLVQKNILRRVEKQFLWVFPYNCYPTTDPRPEQAVRQRLHRVLTGNESPDLPTRLLISLLASCDLAGLVFSGPEKKQAKKRMKELAKDESIGAAVSEEIAAVMACVIACTTACAVSSAAIHH